MKNDHLEMALEKKSFFIFQSSTRTSTFGILTYLVFLTVFMSSKIHSHYTK